MARDDIIRPENPQYDEFAHLLATDLEKVTPTGPPARCGVLDSIDRIAFLET
jgi:hypothetical protein